MKLTGAAILVSRGVKAWRPRQLILIVRQARITSLKENYMLRARLFVGLAIGVSLFTVGCGGSAAGDPVTILTDFQDDSSAASQKYQGKNVRLRVEKVISAGKSGKALEFVTVQGQAGNIIIDATVTDPAEQEKALALKIGDPASFEGEPGAGMGELRGAGALFLKSAKVIPN